ncbi:beta-ketoacyl-ACP synthase III [Halosaccharopolyspora lacisalsi]
MTPAAVVCGIGGHVPERVVTNDELSSMLDTSDEWIRTRTGIRTRHVVEPGGSTGDLAVRASEAALRSCGRRAVDAVVLATSTPDRPCPATAPEVASRLGLNAAVAFDVAAVCAGFVYALATTSSMITSGIVDSALVVGADTFSTILAPTDRTTRAIFGDGAGALVLRKGQREERGVLGEFDLGSDGTGVDLITVPAGGSRQRSTGSAPDETETYFTMQGKPVFVEAVKRMSGSVTAVAARQGWGVADVDQFAVHQANARILAAMAENLGVPVERFARNIERVGNTVAASIPLALRDAVDGGSLSAGDRVVLSGFGGGLAWGSVGLVWPDLTPAESEENRAEGIPR